MRQQTLNEVEPAGEQCPTCTEKFDSEKGVKIHHKLTHGESIAGVEKKCAICGEIFRSKPHRADIRSCCSQECRGEYISENYSGQDAPGWKGGLETVSCAQCGSSKEVKPYQLERSERFFCALECHIAWKREVDLSGENSGAWEGGLVSVSCATCGAEKEVSPHRTENYERHFCSQQCKTEWQKVNQSGPGNPRWNGGSDAYRGVVAALGPQPWSVAAEQARSGRDSCVMCGEAPEQKLDAHHIVPVLAGGCHAPELLMPLCRSCHVKTESYTRDIPEIEPVLVE
jgi:endogenous inhibitor of DNA gyrase (YacG/DUF329 family)